MLISKSYRFGVALLVCTPALATANLTQCTNGDLHRSVEVVYSDPGHPVPCEVLYNKPSEGTQESLWQANNEAGYCEDRAREFIGKLGEMGWACTTASTETPGEPEADASPELIEEEAETDA